jgi:charged multivesicular body protein 7
MLRRQIIRILENGQAVADHPITEVERGIMSVKNALRKVELQIEGVEAQVAG